jgi:hypothetical protein
MEIEEPNTFTMQRDDIPADEYVVGETYEFQWGDTILLLRYRGYTEDGRTRLFDQLHEIAIGRFHARD